MPRATKERMAGFKQALREHGVGLATLQPMYRWASPFEDERQWAVRCWKKAIEVAVDRDSVRIDPLGKRAKDYGSAAVTIVLLIAGMTWVTILGSHYL